MAKKKSVTAVDAPKTQLDWKAEEDARILADAVAIRLDPQRLARAARKAKVMAAEEERRAKEATGRARAMRKLAKRKVTKKKSTVKKKRK